MIDEGIKKHIIEQWLADFDEFLVLVGMKVEGKELEAEKNKYGKFVNINDLIFFARRSIELKNVVLEEMLENKEEKIKQDKEFEAELPELLKPEIVQGIKEQKEIRLAKGISYDSLEDEEKKKEIFNRLFAAYKISMARLSKELIKILQEDGIRITFARGLKLVQNGK